MPNEIYAPFYLVSADARDINKTQAQGLSAQVASIEPSSGSFYNVVVSALAANEGVDQNGVTNGDLLSSYSTVGSSVWIAAHGGEYGRTYPAMVTTDIEGCGKGYAKAGESVDFNAGEDPLNANCNYTQRFNGTSSAAPVTSGAFALVFDANPELTWRDAKDILARTAQQIGADFTPITVETGNGLFTAEPGWLTNAAGFHFHNWYGFGRIDATAAVELAQSPNYVKLPPLATSDFISYAGKDAVIPESPSGTTQSLAINENLTIEAVQLKVSITHGRDADLAIELISPAGTRSMLMSPRSLVVYDQAEAVSDAYEEGWGIQKDYKDTVLLSNAFYGESSDGEWTIKVTDTNSGEFTFYGANADRDEFKEITRTNNSSLGQLTDWSIRIYGH